MRRKLRADMIRTAAVLLTAALLGAFAPAAAYAALPEEVAADEYWYFLDTKGVPFNLDGKDSGMDIENSPYRGLAIKRTEDEWLDLEGDESGDEIFTDVAAKVINKKTHLFDRDGKMLTGLYRLYDVRTEGGKTLGASTKKGGEGGVYYFYEKPEDRLGEMKKNGEMIIELGEGNRYFYRFKSDGSAYTDTILEGGTLYGHDGSRVAADKGKRAVTVGNEEDNLGSQVTRSGANIVYAPGTVLLVTTSGRVVKNGERVKADDQYYKVKNYVATLIVEDGGTN